MPYIKPERRKYFDERINNMFCEALLETCSMGIGDLNYIVTRLCRQYLNRGEKNYAALNEIIGMLECAKLELYRRKVVPYEEQKISENGDVQ